MPPTLDAPATNVTVFENAGVQTINLTGISPGTSGNPTVNVYAVSSDNGTVITAPTVNYTNSSNTGALSFAPVTNAVGTAIVTVTVDNGGLSNNPTSETFYDYRGAESADAGPHQQFDHLSIPPARRRST